MSQNDNARMEGYQSHKPDLFDNPHMWTTLLGNPNEVLCTICGQMETQTDEGTRPWAIVREGRK